MSNEESVSKPSSHEPSLHSGRYVQEAPARHLRSSGESAATSVPVRKDPPTSTPEAKSKDPFGSFYCNRLRRKPHVFCKTYKRTKPSSTEPSTFVFFSSFYSFHHFSNIEGKLALFKLSYPPGCWVVHLTAFA